MDSQSSPRFVWFGLSLNNPDAELMADLQAWHQKEMAELYDMMHQQKMAEQKAKHQQEMAEQKARRQQEMAELLQKTIQDWSFKYIKCQQKTQLGRKKLNRARENLQQVGFKLDRLLQSVKNFQQRRYAEYWPRAALQIQSWKFEQEKNSKSVLKNVQTLQEKENAFHFNPIQNCMKPQTKVDQNIMIQQQSSLEQEGIINDDLSRVTKKKICPSQFDQLKKNSEALIPREKFETDSNDSQEDASDKDKHESNHDKDNEQTTLSEPLSPSKSKGNTTYKSRQYVELEKVTNRNKALVKTLEYLSQ